MRQLFSILRNLFACIGFLTVTATVLLFFAVSVKTGLTPVELTEKVVRKGLSFVMPGTTQDQQIPAINPDSFRPVELSPHVSVAPTDESIVYHRQILRVGPERNLKLPSDAAKIAQSGDIIEIDAGSYVGDVALWKTPRLIIRGVGGRAILEAGGKAYANKAIWVIGADDVFIENMGFKNCRVHDRNGAGIRMEGRNLKIRNCLFWANENGILGGSAEKDSSLTIRYSEFGFNGHGDGQSHGIYIGGIDRFVFEFNYVHHTRTGNQVKSRARFNLIAYNFITDGDNGNSSYAIDLEDGGKAQIIGNVIHKSKYADNSAMIHYGMPNSKSGENFYVINNTASTDRNSSIFVLNHSPAEGWSYNNLLCGKFKTAVGKIIEDANMIVPKTCFTSTFTTGYALNSGCRAIDAGKILNEANGTDLVPHFEYAYPLSKKNRAVDSHIYIGAYEK